MLKAPSPWGVCAASAVLLVAAPAWAEEPVAATLSSDDEEVPEVKVEGTRPHPSRLALEPGVAGYTVRRERLEQPGVTLPDALREAPGVQVTQTGGIGAPATVRLRGATAAETPVYLGAVRINDEVGGVADLSSVPTYLIERVEVYRGHAPKLATQLGMGGAIVLVPRRAKDSEMALSVEAGSWGARALRGHAGLVHGDRKLLVVAEAYGAENDYPYHDTRGTLFVQDDGGTARLQNAESQGQAVWIQAEDRLGKAQLSVVAHYAGREQGAPKLALVPTQAAQARFDRSLFAVDATIPWSTSKLSLSTRIITGRTILNDPSLELGMLTPRSSTPGERVEQVVEAHHDIGDRFWMAEQLTLSVERFRRFEQAAGRDELQISAKRWLLRPSLNADVNPVGGLHFAAAAALDCVSTSEASISLCEQGYVTGRVNARYETRNWDVYANMGRYQRLPTLSELYGAGLLVRGNDRLLPEAAWSPEIGARAQWGKMHGQPLVWGDVSAFARYSSELITYVRTAQGYLRPVNRNRARTVGAEFTAGLAPARGLSLDGNVSLTDARDTSEERVVQNDVLPYISRLTAYGRIGYSYFFDSLPHWDSMTVGFVVMHQSDRYADPAGLAVIPAQTFGDVEWGTSAFSEVLDAKVRVSNVWNAQRYDIVGFPLPPRSVFFSLEVKW